MKKSRRLIAIIVAACMVLMLIPMGVFAADKSGPPKASESGLATREGDYRLNVVNDADTLMLYDISVGGAGETVSLGAGETLSIGINEGEQFTVNKVGNTNYKVLSENASFQSGDYTNTIGTNFAYKVGAGFKVGEEHIYTLKDGTAYEGEATTMNGKTVAADTAVQGNVTLNPKASGTTVSISFNGVTNTSPALSGNFTVSGSGNVTSASAANQRAAAFQTAADALFNDYTAGLGLDATWETVKPSITASYSNGLFGLGRSVSYASSGPYYSYQPLNDEIIDVVDEFPTEDITLTYTTETEAKQGNLSLNILNGERLDDLHSKVNTELVVSMMSLLTGGQGEEGTGMSMDTFSNLLTNEDLMGLLSIEALDNMPKGYTVTLTEVDQNDGLYEALTYVIPMTETMFINIDMDVMMQEALGSTLFNLAKGQIPQEMLDMEILLPVSIGQTFAQNDIRAGKYTLTITSPGEGWYAADKNTYDVTIADGGTVNNLGGNHVYGNIRTSTLITPLTQAMGMDLGCLGGLAGLMLGSNSLKLVETTGVVFNHKLNHIEFTNAALNVDDNGRVTTNGIPGATFALVDRDRFVSLIDALIGVGGAVVNSVVGGINFNDLLGIRQEITEGDAEEIEVEPGMIEKILISVIALGDRLEGVNVPAILESTADDNGLVTFDPENNVTLQKLINLIPRLMDTVEGIGNFVGQIGSIIPGYDNSAESGAPAGETDPDAEPAEPAAPSSGGLANLSGLDMGSVLQILSAIGDPDQIGALGGLLNSLGGMGGSTTPNEPAEPSEPAEPADPSEPSDPAEPGEESPDMMQVLLNLLQDFGGGDLGFAVLNLVGLSDGRFPTGNYLLIQTSVPEGRVRNPMMYVFNNTWDAEEKAYHTYAGIDLAGVMSNEQFAIFADQLEQSYVVLEEIFDRLATTADGGLSVVQAFLGEDPNSYNSQALFDLFDDITRKITAQIAAAQAEGELETTPEGIPLISPGLKAALSGILDQVLNTFIPKATVLTYFSNLIYRTTGDLFGSQEDVSQFLLAMADEDLSFTGFNARIHNMLNDADYVLNGEVTRNWYYYDVNPNIFTNVNVAYHYIINEMLPAPLANVVERALQGYIDGGEALVDELINQIVNGNGEEAPVPDEPDAPDLPGTDTSGSWFTGIFNFVGGFFKNIGGFFKNIFKWF